MGAIDSQRCVFLGACSPEQTERARSVMRARALESEESLTNRTPKYYKYSISLLAWRSLTVLSAFEGVRKQGLTTQFPTEPVDLKG